MKSIIALICTLFVSSALVAQPQGRGSLHESREAQAHHSSELRSALRQPHDSREQRQNPKQLSADERHELRQQLRQQRRQTQRLDPQALP